MPHPITMCLSATAFGSVVYLNGSYLKAFIVGWLVLTFVQALWKYYLYPFHFSPLLKLPQAPRGTWKSFIKPRDPNEVLEWHDNVPNDGLIRYLDIFNVEVVTLTEPKLIADYLHTKAYHYVKRPHLKIVLGRVLGDGLVTSDGTVHKHQRKNLLPAFSTKAVKNLYPLFWTKACECVSLIKRDIATAAKFSPGSPPTINAEEWSGRASLDIIGKAGFDTEFNSLSKPDTPINTAYRSAFIPDSKTAWLLPIALMAFPRLMFALPLKKNTTLRGAVRVVTEFVRTRLREKRLILDAKADDMGFEENSQKDIISVAMETGAFTVEDLVNQSKTLLGAGHETSATAVTWGIYLLSLPRHSQIQSRLRAEIRAHLPSPESGEPITSDMLDNLPYLNAVSKEIMRVHAPIPMIARQANEDTDICGVRIPKGTDVRVHVWAVNKSKKLWGEDARVFRPERWLEDVHGGAESLSYLTFGYGPRSCIGRGFAQGENKALLAALIGSFDFKPAGGQPKDIEVVFAVTAKIMGGLKVEATVVEGW